MTLLVLRSWNSERHGGHRCSLEGEAGAPQGYEDTFPSSLQPAFGAFSSFSFGEFSFVLTLYPKFTLSGIFAQVTSHSTFEQSGVVGAIAWYAEPSEARVGVHWSVRQQDEGW